MIDGYSVQEAASVLGVAEGRVWELLARGVLTGTPEGDSMRVFLKAQPGPIAPAREEPRTNGNGGSHGNGGEASAFRELLTEFRNLTERYGQALLALGEARGEVAGLRSRVDQLEARLDLRLPPPVDAAPVAWDSLTVPASTPEEAPARPQRAMPRRATPRKPARRKQRPRKERSPREAVAGFADALARAQDPNAADLGETTEEMVPAEPMTEAADVAFEVAAEVAPEEAVAGEPEAEAAAPEPVAAIEETPAEVEPPTYSAAVVEPDWFADGDFAWLDAADMEGSTQAAAAPVTPEAAEPEPEEAVAETVVAPEAMVAAEPELEPEPQAAQEPEIAREPAVEAEPEPQAAQEPEIAPEPAVEAEAATAPSVEATGEFGPAAEFESEAAFEPEAEFETWQPPAPVVRELPDEPATADAPEPPTMNTAVAVEDVEEEVMWLGREAEPAPRVEDEPPLDYRAEAEGWPEVDAAPAVQAARPPLAMTEDELARLALDEGWDDSEVAAIRAMITPPSSATVDLPGAAELHEAMAALDAVPVRTDPQYDASRQWSKPTPDDEEEPARNDDWAFEAEPAPPPPAPARPPIDVTSTLRHSADDPGWLERRQGPAAAAYRRLRRLLPG